MLDPRVFTHRRLSAGSLSIFIQFFVFYGFIFLVLQYLQLVRRDSALVAAVSMLPMAVTMMPTSRLAPKLAARFGSRAVCVAGLIGIAAALAIIAQLDADTAVLAPRRWAARSRRRDGRRDDAGHQRDHQRAAEGRSRASPRR